MNKLTTFGIDLAKSAFQAAVLSPNNKLIQNKSYSRTELIELMKQQPPSIVGMEACSSAHYWAKRFIQMGHTVKLLPPAYVKGFVYGNKHDANDAKAIALAATLPESPTVQPKSTQQLALQALMRVRARRIKNQGQCASQIRGLLAEHGIVIPKGYAAVKNLVVRLDQVPEAIRPLIGELIDEFRAIDQRVNAINKEIERLVKAHPLGQRLLALPGIGIMNALAGLIINPSDFSNGRHYAAYLGLVPKQTGTGGQIRTTGMSKRGNRYHRKLLCDGARAFLNCTKDRSNPLWIWAHRIKVRKGHNTAVVALANKLSKISFHVLNGESFDINKAVCIK